MWFSLLLVVLFIVTGIFWVLDTLIFKKARIQKAEAIKAQMKGGYDDAVQEALARPLWLEYTAGLFGVVALVFVLRSFITEPFRIPSSSMVPTLLEGDFLLVNKYAYGLRMPITNTVVVMLDIQSVVMWWCSITHWIQQLILLNAWLGCPVTKWLMTTNS